MRIVQTKKFMDDIASIKDDRLYSAISQRLHRVAGGNLGDYKSIGDGVSELRIHYGAGYRIYYTVRGREIIFLLCGGPKSDQKRDIKKAKELNKGIEL